MLICLCFSEIGEKDFLKLDGSTANIMVLLWT